MFLARNEQVNLIMIMFLVKGLLKSVTTAAKQGSQVAVLNWPEPDIALITMIRDKELNT